MGNLTQVTTSNRRHISMDMKLSIVTFVAKHNMYIDTKGKRCFHFFVTQTSSDMPRPNGMCYSHFSNGVRNGLYY